VTFFNEEILTVAGNVACFAPPRFNNGNILEVAVLWHSKSEVRNVSRLGFAGYPKTPF
jgi:hypothetical protein